MFVNTFSIIGNVSLLAFSGFHALRSNYLFAVIELSFFAIGLLNIIALRKTRNADLASSIILFFMIGVLVFLYATGGTGNTGFLWYFTYPLLAFFLKGKKHGTLWLLALVGTTLMVFLLQRTGVVPFQAYSTLETAVLTITILVVASLTAFYANVQDRLEEVRAMREGERLQARIMESQLDVARGFQRVLLPAQDIAYEDVSVSAAYRTVGKVGGDYFDFVPIDENRIAVILCDVSGHGVPAALGMVNIRAIFRTLLKKDVRSPAQIMREINNTLVGELQDDYFITSFFFIYDRERREVIYCNAGQPPAIHYSDGTLSEITSVALPLGVTPENPYRDKTMALRRGDLFIIYTDGIVEAMNEARDAYGPKRLFRTIAKSRHQTATQINEAVIDDVDVFLNDHRMSDDISIVTLKVE